MLARDYCTTEHRYGPADLAAWSAWSADLARTHEQQQCPDCGLWVIWIPHDTEQPAVDEPGLFDLVEDVSRCHPPVATGPRSSSSPSEQ